MANLRRGYCEGVRVIKFPQIEEIIKSYFKDKKEIAAVFLFGSYARNKASKKSDLDLALLFERQYQDRAFQKRAICIVELGRLLKKDIHPVILNTAGEELAKQIFSKGKVLITNNPRELSLYRMIMLTKIIDFSYYRGRMQKGLIRKVMEGGTLG